MVRYAWAAKALLRDTALDAAGDLLRERAWASITMADIARDTGVSRQTLYTEFGGRRPFAQAYVLREADRLMTGVEAVIGEHADDPQGAIAAAFERFLDDASQTALVAAIAGRDGGDELLALVTVQGGELLRAATTRLTAFLRATWPQVSAGDARAAVDVLVRMAISHAALPGEDPARAAKGLARALGPFVDQVLMRH
jgi:AcrR family transcriptional regulator